MTARSKRFLGMATFRSVVVPFSGKRVIHPSGWRPGANFPEPPLWTGTADMSGNPTYRELGLSGMRTVGVWQGQGRMV